MLTNYHTHTTFCDGKAGVDEMADAAEEKGFDVLGFSGHAPVPFPTRWAIKEGDLPAYAEAVRARAARPGSTTEIMLGLEIDWIPGLSSPADARWDGAGLDYRIGSTHFVVAPDGTRFAVDENEADFGTHLSSCYSGDARALVRDYYDAVAAMCAEGGFDILGHFDLVRKNDASYGFIEEGARWYRDAWQGAVDAAVACGAIVEINTGGMARGKTVTPYPSLDILRVFRERGARITVNSDAHAAGHLGASYDAAYRLAREAGYSCAWYLSRGEWKEGALPGSN